MLDWVTVVIEVVGVAIFLTWIIVPLREFRQILRALKDKPMAADDRDDVRGGLDVARPGGSGGEGRSQ